MSVASQHSRNGGDKEEQPCLRVLEALNELLAFPVLVLDTGLVSLDPLNGNDALFRCQEPGIRRRIWEQEPVSGG